MPMAKAHQMSCHFLTLALLCGLGFPWPAEAQPATTASSLLIRVCGDENKLVTGAKVMVSMAFGTPISAIDLGDGTYRVSLPASSGSCTVEVTAEGFEPSRTSLMFSGNQEVNVYLLSRDRGITRATSSLSEQYTPPGRWIQKTPSGNSTWTGQVWMPDIIPEGESRLQEGSILKPGNPNLLYSPRAEYEDIFYELLLQTKGDPDAFAVDMLKQGIGVAKTADAAISVLKGVKLSENRSLLSKEFPSQFATALLLLEAANAWDDADVEAVLAYVSLQAFNTARYRCLVNCLRGIPGVSTEMSGGLEDAYARLQRERGKELEQMRTEAKSAAVARTLVKGVAQIVTGSTVGPAIASIAGGGLLGASLAYALPAAWFWQLSRTYTANEAEAQLVLLSTIDRTVMVSALSNARTAVDRYMAEQVREHLSWMSTQCAAVYASNATLQPSQRAKVLEWANGHPHYDAALLDGFRALAEKELRLIPAAVEEQIAELLFPPGKSYKPYKSKLEALEFDYKDVDGDGKDEVFVLDLTETGAQNGSWYIYRVQPLQPLLRDTVVCCEGISLLPTSHFGYRDLAAYYHVGGVVVQLWLHAPPEVFIWNGSSYIPDEEQPKKWNKTVEEIASFLRSRYAVQGGLHVGSLDLNSDNEDEIIAAADDGNCYRAFVILLKPATRVVLDERCIEMSWGEKVHGGYDDLLLTICNGSQTEEKVYRWNGSQYIAE
jgi:hypothetical protein